MEPNIQLSRACKQQVRIPSCLMRVKYKLISLTLIGATMTWFKILRMGVYICGRIYVTPSLPNLYVKSDNTRLWSYSARPFKKIRKPYTITLTVSQKWRSSGGTNDGLKCWVFKKKLIPNFMFWEKSELEGACNISDFLNMAHPYINYE